MPRGPLIAGALAFTLALGWWVRSESDSRSAGPSSPDRADATVSAEGTETASGDEPEHLRAAGSAETPRDADDSSDETSAGLALRPETTRSRSLAEAPAREPGGAEPPSDEPPPGEPPSAQREDSSTLLPVAENGTRLGRSSRLRGEQRREMMARLIERLGPQIASAEERDDAERAASLRRMRERLQRHHDSLAGPPAASPEPPAQR